MPGFRNRLASYRHILFIPARLLFILFIPAAFASFDANEPQLRAPAEPPLAQAARAPSTADAGRIIFPDETPCFPVLRIKLTGNSVATLTLPLQQIAEQAVGRCLGVKGTELLTGALQNYLIDHGYLTARILAPSQDLTTGRLILIVLPNSVHNVMLNGGKCRYSSARCAVFPNEVYLL